MQRFRVEDRVRFVGLIRHEELNRCYGVVLEAMACGTPVVATAVGAVPDFVDYPHEHELGYLYNFLYRDSVSNYQSGFRFGPDDRHKPGLVAHALAIRHYAGSDLRGRKYSFLAGAS